MIIFVDGKRLFCRDCLICSDMGNLTIGPFGETEYNELLQQAVAVSPWGYNLLLMDKMPKSTATNKEI